MSLEKKLEKESVFFSQNIFVTQTFFSGSFTFSSNISSTRRSYKALWDKTKFKKIIAYMLCR